MDESTKDELGVRLKRIAGQVAGIQKMIEERRRDLDVVLQVSAARAALAKVARLVLTAHLRDGVTEALKDDSRDMRKKIEELVQVFEHCQL